MRRILVTGVALTALVLVGSAASSLRDTDPAIAHVLNRIGFGPRAGDVARVRAVGIRHFIDGQLRPERITDDGMTTRLAGLSTVRMSSSELWERYERPTIEARRQNKLNAKTDGPDAGAPKQLDPLRRRANILVAELAEQKVLRAAYSERQLQEVLTDFWFNHFNVDARKNRERFLLTEYERDVIRPRVLGSFRELLGATAKSPAMLFYLDNWLSADPNSPPATRRGAAVGGAGSTRGLNENYARELMELHTLGVDGGYTQKDVTEVARALTGWTIDPPRQSSGFHFEPRMHDNGQKTVLGHVINGGGGESDGERVLDILASQPSTARFIATKLARHFVSDTPPPSLVGRAAKRFIETRGDLREVTRTILTSPEFLSPAAYGVKVKTPFELVVSALRATGADVVDAKAIVRQLQQLGMPLYMCQPPTGYKDTADAWMNTGALVGRMNYALTLAGRDRDLALTLGSPEFQRR